MYKRILVPLENTPADDTILGHIRALAKSSGAHLTLIHVANGFVARHYDKTNLAESEEMREDYAYLEKRQQELVKDGIEVQINLARGDPADQILAKAQEEGCDLIAMSTHGHRLLSDFVLGSVASAVRHRTNIPVLLVRAHHK